MNNEGESPQNDRAVVFGSVVYGLTPGNSEYKHCARGCSNPRRASFRARRSPRSAARLSGRYARGASVTLAWRNEGAAFGRRLISRLSIFFSVRTGHKGLVHKIMKQAGLK
jgi:hypothetical protein